MIFIIITIIKQNIWQELILVIVVVVVVAEEEEKKTKIYINVNSIKIIIDDSNNQNRLFYSM